MSKSLLLMPLLGLLAVLAGCGSTGPSAGSDSACGRGREATQACQVERYMKVN